MESILLAAIVGKHAGGSDGVPSSLDDLRSPTIPYPPDLDDDLHLRSPRSSVLTERTLKNAHLSWLIRKRNLTARLEALETAATLGLLGTWAGDATEYHIRSVKEAVVEACWVEERLKEAVRWVNERPIKPPKLRQLLKGAKQGQRPSHTEYPLVLHDLPYPLPSAPASSVYTLTVERPPPIDLDHRNRTDLDLDARPPPPAYQAEADCRVGETTVERGAEVVEYQRRIDRSALVDRASLQTVIGSPGGFPTAWG